MIQTGRKIGNWILLAGVALILLEGIFVDFTMDSEYAIAQAYRMVKGDGLFLQMWEPHQTSAFLCAALIRLWMALAGSLQGVVLFLHAAGLLLKLGVLAFLVSTLKSSCSRGELFSVAVFFLAASPKGLLLPEFSNMQLYFSVCLFCCLLRHLRRQEGIFWLAAAALSLCLETLSYPTCALICLIVVFYLSKYAVKKRRDILVFLGICVLAGGLFIGCYVGRLGPGLFLECVGNIIKGDGSHTGALQSKWLIFARDFGLLSLYYGIILLLAFLGACLVASVRKRKGRPQGDFWKRFFALFFLLLMLCGMGKCLIQTNYFLPREGTLVLLDLEELYLPLMGLGIFSVKYCKDEQKLPVSLGMAIGLGGAFATLLLTNLGLNHSLGYLVLGVGLSLIPVGRWAAVTKEEKQTAALSDRLCAKIVAGVLVTVVFRNAFLIEAMHLTHYNRNIFEVQNVVKSGPAIGIVSDYMGTYVMNRTMEEWKDLIRPGDNVIIVGADKVSTLAYLYEDVNICIDSTICTPTYDEKLLRYWELNPDKAPNVAVVDCWYGELRMDEDSWIMQWIYREFGRDAYRDGSYIRCFRRE